MTYADALAAAWQAHLEPKTASAPTVVSAFAGCGGSSLGYSMAGYRELLAIEWDDHAVGVFRANFPHVPVHHGDIAAVDPACLGVAPGMLDVLDGSPPCQGFSTSGRRQIDDPRNQLFREFVRLLRAWQPRAFVMENVSGMVRGQMKSLFAEILTELKAAGYRVTARLVDASYLGVPQMRKRVIFVGVRCDLGPDPVHPAPATRPRTVHEALADLSCPGIFDVPSGKGSVLAALVPPGANGSATLMRRGGKGSFFNCVRLRWDRPANTITKEYRAANGAGLLHPDENRFMGVRELARLQSFPDEFDWGAGTYRQIHARIGNSVPPLMMRAVAETIRSEVLGKAGAARPS
ncbi:MAG TPA: DNA cytosine methyltransferase [Streptosporangiaceae bacterium]|nr:DNA cytosine methyltransferase [Streptosporangiaceae bacterium]